MNDHEFREHLKEIHSKYESIQKELFLINQKLYKMTLTLDDLKAKVDAETTVEQSAITLLQGLSQKLKDAMNDPAKIQAIADEIDANSASLSQAITANTPA